MLYKLYQKLILKYPLSVFILLLVSILIFGMNVTKLALIPTRINILAIAFTIAKYELTKDILS